MSTRHSDDPRSSGSSRAAGEEESGRDSRGLFDPPLKPEPRPVGSEAPSRRPARPAKRRRKGDSAPLSLPLFPELEDDEPVDPVDAEVDELDVDPPLELPDDEPPGDSGVEEGAEVADDLLAASVEDAGEDWSESDALEEPELPYSPPPSPEPEDPFDVPVRLRALAGLADLAVHGALLLLVLLGERLVGMRWDLDQWPGLAIFLLTFSFLYTVIPLAFWGQTPGMSVAGILACAEDGENLSFPQTAARWAAGLLTLLLLGLPLVAALWGPSLSDRLSQSLTRRALE
ncbi:MAG: RDD family protein [Acidobacteriota bacterium]|nr:RDD family protein [Acidobacteriota bacterium]